MKERRQISIRPLLLALTQMLFSTALAGCEFEIPAMKPQESPGIESHVPVNSVPAIPSPEPSISVSGAETDDPSPASAGDDWMLLLVNQEHPLSENFTVPDLVELQGGHAIDSRAYSALQAMLDDARAEGLQPVICSSYRSQDIQERLFEKEVQLFLNQGCSEDEAQAQAAMWVAIPGTSEHQTGLAVDIVDASYQILDEGQENTAVQQWLMVNCAKYGFILRYPTDKSEITKIHYEPWHYRYVGEETAKKIMESGLCLEEYLQQQ